MARRKPAQRTIRLEFPATLGSDDFERVVGVLGSTLPIEARVELDLARTKFAPLDVLVSALYLCNELAARANHVVLDWGQNQPTFGYADRMGFFKLLNEAVLVQPERPGRFSSLHTAHNRGNPQLLEMTPLEPGDRDIATRALDDLQERLARNLASLPHSKAVIDNIWTFAAEAIGNIDEHSQTPVPGLVAAQRYNSPTRGPRLHLVIADGGLGIPATIRSGNPAAEAKGSDVEIILAAFREGLSRRGKRGHGCGLTTCARIAMLYKGNLRVRAGGTWARLITKSARAGLSLGFFDDAATPISGTHLSLDFYLDRMEEVG